VLERYADADGRALACLLDCRLETGRTHQIRVHLAAIGHPLLCDDVYGPGFRTKANLLPPAARDALAALGRQALHAYMLAIEHPTTGERLDFRTPLPPDLALLRGSLTVERSGVSLVVAVTAPARTEK
jgi:23S rRNA pseudouridine1911/1915/1917 synthase